MSATTAYCPPLRRSTRLQSSSASSAKTSSTSAGSTIPFWWDLGIVCAFSLGIYLWALAVRLSPEETKRYIGDLTEEDREEREELHETAPAR